jgi:hypothetical protein
MQKGKEFNHTNSRSSKGKKSRVIMNPREEAKAILGAVNYNTIILVR